MLTGATLVAIAGGFSSFPSMAYACSCGDSGRHELYAATSLPQGAGVAVWHSAPFSSIDGGPQAAAPIVTAVDEHGEAVHIETSSPFENVWFFAFPDAAPGSTVELTSTAPGYDNDEPPYPLEHKATVKIEAPVAAADDLGMHVTVPFRRSWKGDECDGPDLSIVAAQVVPILPPALQPFEDAVVTELLIDGDRGTSFARGACEVLTPTESRFGFDPHTAWAVCEGNRKGVSEGEHELQLRAWLPGMTTPWVSAPQTVRLDCGAVEVDHDAGTNGGSADPESGCSTTSANPAWWLLVAGFAGLRRRRSTRA